MLGCHALVVLSSMLMGAGGCCCGKNYIGVRHWPISCNGPSPESGNPQEPVKRLSNCSVYSRRKSPQWGHTLQWIQLNSNQFSLPVFGSCLARIRLRQCTPEGITGASFLIGKKTATPSNRPRWISNSAGRLTHERSTISMGLQINWEFGLSMFGFSGTHLLWVCSLAQETFAIRRVRVVFLGFLISAVESRVTFVSHPAGLPIVIVVIIPSPLVFEETFECCWPSPKAFQAVVTTILAMHWSCVGLDFDGRPCWAWPLIFLIPVLNPLLSLLFKLLWSCAAVWPSSFDTRSHFMTQ